VVERYQDVYPTKQQTGAELFQLVSLASRSFNRVALYFENSIAPLDRALLPAGRLRGEPGPGDRRQADCRFPARRRRRLDGPRLVDGAPWPAADGATSGCPPVPISLKRRPLRPPCA